MGSTNGSEAIKPLMLIDGQLVGASDGNTFPLFNPATGDKVADVPEATKDDVNNAVAAAQRAFPAWSALDPAKRGGYMKKLAGLIRQHNDELALLEAKSMGRPLPEFFEGYAAAGSYEYYAEAWPHIQGQASLNTPGYVTMTLRQPFGVVGAIIPWNAALLFFAGKTAPALITGNTVVLKSSEKAPLGAAKFAELIHKAGFPPGVFNVISGHGNPSGAALSSHMDVRAISFTGSGRTGRAIQEAAAKSNLKKVILELGGKSPVIIFDDADIEQAAKDTMHSIQWNSGQVCMANSRVYVQDTIAEKFIEASKKVLAAAKPGDPTQKGVDHGPQADKTQYETVLSYIDEGKKSGKLVQGGKGSYDKTGGFFIEPTIFLDTDENAKIMKEEIFGPVVNINVIQTEEDAIQKANDTEYGLYAAVYTKNIDRAMRVTQQLNSGYVGINCTSPTTARDLPFGGYKSSGQGREGYLYSMDNFLEVKSVMMKVELLSSKTRLAQLRRYVPTFRNVTELFAGPSASYGVISIPNTKAIMPMGFEYPFVIHPATLDSALHLLFLSISGEDQSLDGAVLPFSFDRVFVSASISTVPGTRLHGYSTAQKTSYNTWKSSITISEDLSQPMIIMEGLSLASVGDGASTQLTGQDARASCFTQTWHEDVD
ncbi:aldehyde dehydrogenase [Fusarium denticulatum]|uniref:aldehyde dehydrogenase (NAD(+)) n=1 Tax=Fusarium denticulatum TaxID=48507 RepID=A0A8H5WN19_9HYPO|nr:aldehyde dehydrogenase [Fusarium denticulatum]